MLNLAVFNANLESDKTSNLHRKTHNKRGKSYIVTIFALFLTLRLPLARLVQTANIGIFYRVQYIDLCGP